MARRLSPLWSLSFVVPTVPSAPGGVPHYACVCLGSIHNGLSCSSWHCRRRLAFVADALQLSLSPMADSWPSLDLLVNTLPPLSLVSSFADAFVVESVMVAPFYGYFVVVGVFSSSPLDAWPSGEPWWMLCCHWLFGPLFGRCFVGERC